MTAPDQVNGWIIWLRANRGKLLPYMRGLQILVGLAFLLLGWTLGHRQCHLVRSGTRTQGRIVGSSTATFRSGSSGTTGTAAYMPVVEFQAAGRTARFTNWLGSSFSPTLNQTVPILYDASDPSVAMIDRPVMNWIPWGPTAAVGGFLWFFQKFRKHLLLVERAMGALLVATGFMFLTGALQELSYWLLEAFPGLAQLG